MSSLELAPSLSEPRLGGPGRPVGPVRAALGRALHAYRQRRARQQLRALDDHALRDVGLLRDQIDDVLRISAQRQRDWLRQHGG